MSENSAFRQNSRNLSVESGRMLQPQCLEANTSGREKKIMQISCLKRWCEDVCFQGQKQQLPEHPSCEATALLRLTHSLQTLVSLNLTSVLLKAILIILLV